MMFFFVGLVHSHKSKKNLSYADIEYAKNIILSNHLDWIYMVIFVHENNKLYAYRINMKEELYVNEEEINVK